MSKRADIAWDMASKDNPYEVEHWLTIIYAFEAAGYQVVKTSETAEFQGLRNAGGLDD